MVKTDPKISRDNMSVAWAEKIVEVSEAMQQAMNDGNRSNADQIGEMIPDLVDRMREATHGNSVPTQQHVLVAMSVALDVFPPIDGTSEALNDAITQELCLLLLSDNAESVVGSLVDGYSVDGVIKMKPTSFPADAFGLGDILDLAPEKKKKTKKEKLRPLIVTPDEYDAMATSAKSSAKQRQEAEDSSGSRRTLPLGVIAELLMENNGITIGHVKQMTEIDIRMSIDDIRAKLALLAEIVKRHSDTPAAELLHMDADGVREHAKFILRAPSVHQDNSACEHEFSMDHEVTGLSDGVLGVTGTCCKCGSTFDHQFQTTEVDWDERA